MSPPPRKRLKQTTLVESFKKQSSQDSVFERRISQPKSPNSPNENTMTDREKILLAAERRRDEHSPDVTPQPDDSESDKQQLLLEAAATNISKELSEKEAPSNPLLKALDIAESKTNSENLVNTLQTDTDHKADTDPSDTTSRDQSETRSDVTDLLTTGASSSSSKYCGPEIIDSSSSDSNDCRVTDVSMGSTASKKIPHSPMILARSVSQDKLEKGTPRSELNTQPSCSATLPKFMPSRHHTVLIDTRHFTADVTPRPFPKTYEDRWDSDHVKMPCSPDNIYPVEENGVKKLEKRWDLIETALLSGISTPTDLMTAILKYNQRYSNKWDFSGLHHFFWNCMEANERNEFFSVILPKIVALALRLPTICTKAIPLLRRNYPHSVTMSQEQAACLLANAFFCTFPRCNAHTKQSEYTNYPDINFVPLYASNGGHVNRRKVEKLRCIINYFRRVTTSMPTSTITFRRQVKREFPFWVDSDAPFTRLHVTNHGTIEKGGVGMLQVDFANKYVGGGVLGDGCVQEEIRFLLCPEMILSRLFTEVLGNNECLIMTGCEQFNDYSSYADSFKWAGNHNDTTARDAYGRRYTEVVAIDVLVFHNYSE